MDEAEPRMAPEDIIQFWFAPENRAHWFAAPDAFDAKVRERFGTLAERASTGELDDWARTPEGALALILLLDRVLVTFTAMPLKRFTRGPGQSRPNSTTPRSRIRCLS
jgi:uncharacterized protein (DUF924 family)